jgi:signal transduction histidine kinase
MKTNYELFDKIILFISCTFIYLSFFNNTLSVLPILIALTLTCFLIIFDKRVMIRLILYLLFVAISLYNQDLVFFIPLIAYDLFNEENKFLYILPLIPLSQFILNFGLLDSMLVIVVFVVAVFIRFKSIDIIGYKKKYYDVIDTSKELSLKLNEQNKDLIEKQDNEIFIATLNERNRIAREIHDHVGHQLSSAILQLGALMAICKDESTKSNLLELKKTLDIGMDNIRQSVHNLYDTSIDLNEALIDIIDHFNYCTVTYDNTLQLRPTQKQCYALIAIVKEALSNVMKHSNGTHVSIILREHPQLYQLIIHDNGTQVNPLTDEGIGLKNMAQRIEVFKGHLDIKTNNGFEIFISFPKETLR